jgi:hypothetical protein
MELYQARFTHPTAGWDGGEHPRTELELNEFYEIDYIEIHSMHTRIYLKGFKDWFNSVNFDFYMDGNKVDSFVILCEDGCDSNIDEWK